MTLLWLSDINLTNIFLPYFWVCLSHENDSIHNIKIRIKCAKFSFHRTVQAWYRCCPGSPPFLAVVKTGCAPVRYKNKCKKKKNNVLDPFRKRDLEPAVLTTGESKNWRDLFPGDLRRVPSLPDSSACITSCLHAAKKLCSLMATLTRGILIRN